MKDHGISLVRTLLLALFMVLIGSVPSYGQQVTGGLTGLVTDESKAVIPGAEVTVKNANTGTEVTTTTNENGTYRVPGLTPGVYTISVVAQGFKRAEVAQVTVRLGVDVGLDVVMQVGGASDIVEVTGGEVLIERDTSQISQNYEARKVTDLPINTAGGGVDTIALLTPGVVAPGDASFSNQNGTNLSSNGGRGRSNNFTIDGQDNNDISVAGPAVFVDNADVVQEFQIVTNNFSAEYGQAGGAIVNLVTKGGTNEFHGSAFEFYRDRKLFDTLDAFERRQGMKEAPPELTNTFGFTLGGPIVKDKVLFFGSYQGIRDRSFSVLTSGAGALTLTPNGIATAIQFADPNIANAIKLYAPFSRSVGNPQIDPNVPLQIRTVMIGGRPVPLEFGSITRTLVQPFDENSFTGRIDWNVSSKLRVFGRYLYQKQENTNIDLGRAINGFPSDQPGRSQQVGVTAVYQVSPRAVNELRFNYSRLRANFGGGATQLANNADQELASITMPSGFLAFGQTTSIPQGRINDNYQVLDNFSLTLNKHSLKMGFDLKRRLTDSNFLPNQNGSFRFTTLDRFFNNMPNSASLAIGPNVLNFTEFDQAYYFEDAWRVKDNLTITLGIRYENAGQPINILSEITNKRESDPTTAIFNQNLPLEARVFPGVDTDNNNFAPRIGFAYTPRFAKKIFGENKTVIRGGYGISYDLAFYNILINSASSSPVVLSTTVTGTPGLFPANPAGPGVRAALGNLLPVGQLDPRLLTRTLVSNDFHSPYTQQFSFGLQRQFGNNTVIEARYVGTHSVGQFQSINANPRFAEIAADFPQFLPPGLSPSPNGRLIANSGPVRLRANGASSIYHSLQVRFDTRIANQLTLGSSYTYSKQIDNSSEIFGTLGGGNTSAFSQDPFNTSSAERALGAYDFRHIFSMNFIYDVPGFKGQKGLLGKLLGGYQLSGTFRAFPGQRYTPSQGFFGSPYPDATFYASFNGGVETLRPFIGNPNAPAGTVALDNDTAAAFFGLGPSPTGFYLLNSLQDPNSTGPKAVTLDQVRYIANTGTTALIFGTPYGNVGRNSAQGDDTYVGNFGFFKNTKVGERLNIQFRAEMFNVFNHPNFGVPDPFIDDAGTTFADPTQNRGGRRTVQFGLKLQF